MTEGPSPEPTESTRVRKRPWTQLLGISLLLVLVLMAVALALTSRWLQVEADRDLLANFPTDRAGYDRAADPERVATGVTRLGQLARDGRSEALELLLTAAEWLEDGPAARALPGELLETLRARPEALVKALAQREPEAIEPLTGWLGSAADLHEHRAAVLEDLQELEEYHRRKAERRANSYRAAVERGEAGTEAAQRFLAEEREHTACAETAAALREALVRG